MKKHLLYILPLLAVLSCEKAENGQGNNQDPEKPTPASYTVAGKVEKGPFVQGSSITMATMDAKLNATGKNYTATITDDAGTFSFGTQEFDSQYARLTASGYFFNEVKGELSKGTLTLSAIVDLSNKKSVNVNLLTHLESMRIQKLIGTDGKSFSDAVKQAQEELLTCFEFQQYASTDASQFSITSGTDEAAALILISSIIQMDRSEAQITEWLSKLASDFAEDGQFSDANKEQIFKDRELLYAGLSEISQNIVKRYSELGIYVTVKDISAIVDWDGDGIVGNETLKEGESVTLSPATIEVPAEGGHFTVEIKSPVKVYLEQPNHGSGYLDVTPPSVITPGEIFGDSFYDGVQNSPMSYTKELKDKILTIDVAATQNWTPTSSEIDIYVFSGEKVATLSITQAPAATTEIPKLGDIGKMAMAGFMNVFAQAMTMNNDADKLYTHLKSNPAFIAPMDPNYSSLYDFWSYFYQSINRLLQIKDYDASVLSVYQEYFNIYSAIAFYNMVVFWGDVPYFTTTPSMDNPYLPRTRTADIFSSLENQLKAAIEYAEEKQNVALAEDPNDALFLSKDVARIILAEILAYQGRFSDAIPYLQAATNKGHYGLDNPENPIERRMDIILAVRSQNGTKSSLVDDRYQIIISYPDMLLLLAECELKQGGKNNPKQICNGIENAYGLPLSEGTIDDIKSIRKSLSLPGYFAFLKRNGLAKSEIGLEDYQLILPIPQRELNNNPNMTQNPGY
ncbi:MAG: RagB/SusD family nutrient uptake outer membrane protein [Bacteroidales bacterium]|nr:RagB/SusD family nutrient uptake outer membrane protein [Candidatus Cacconaster equi]